ncbi:CPXCG motif-containing cysteine-rich protein [Pseudoxanthomonas sp.]|uniref:CPXCG motif-containing cysteine-rich protein n=1 Tax=Pseudoxanthomonas sp. TaxID=1871049 RepID=UPI00262BCC8D|nr:CPXCG motif-containing cysteine-rich protein [Pseudoxanthomonas sp.]WDS35551.1 MAG: CPXCG motif-containing cysteine-rich protein [Pseudoxanthomonas sp.]
MLAFQTIHCPYCGEPLDIAVDVSAGDQQYIEDCQVCCRPISMTLIVEEDGDAQLIARAENDA